MKQAAYFLAALTVALLLSGCPPTLYCVVDNRTSTTVHVDFEYEGSGTLLPHFELPPGTSRTSKAGSVLLVHDRKGHLIGSLDISKLPQTEYLNRRTYTFHIAVGSAGVYPIRPER